MIQIIGMGREIGDLTAKGAEAIKSADVVVVRTENSPTVQYLCDNGIKYLSFDELYESANDFEGLNSAIIDRLLSFKGKVVYCVEGGGADDGSVAEIVARGIPVEIIAGVSYSALAGRELPSTSYIVYAAYDIKPTSAFPRDIPIIITEIDNVLLAGEIKLILMDNIGEDVEVILINEKAEKIPLYELDRKEYTNATKCIIPPTMLIKRERFSFLDLLEIMARLRASGGCPWDREQTHKSIRKNLIEEAYELIEGIDLDDSEIMKEESGDVLLQAVFHAKIAEDNGEFTTADMLTELCNKLLTRHTHIFGDVVANNSDEALVAWENAKKKEKESKSKTGYDTIATSLPALVRAEKVLKLYDKMSGKPTTKTEASKQVEIALKSGNIGELILASCNLARVSGEDAEELLAKTTEEVIKKNENR